MVGSILVVTPIPLGYKDSVNPYKQQLNAPFYFIWRFYLVVVLSQMPFEGYKRFFEVVSERLLGLVAFYGCLATHSHSPLLSSKPAHRPLMP
jgi:ABC-type nickel/cobalt efflux system permease component RcnA